MTLSDVAAMTLLGWDTVKAITKKHLAKDYGRPALGDVRYQNFFILKLLSLHHSKYKLLG